MRCKTNAAKHTLHPGTVCPACGRLAPGYAVRHQRAVKAECVAGHRHAAIRGHRIGVQHQGCIAIPKRRVR